MSEEQKPEFKLEVQDQQEEERKKRRAEAGEWMPAFLNALAASANVRVACMQAKISRKTAYQWKEEDAEFAKAWKDALDDGIDLVEYALYKRAINASDKAAIFLLEVHKYGSKKTVEHTGPGGGPIPVAATNVISIIDEAEDEKEDES